MWINKLHLIKAGATPTQASAFINMLNRSCPSKEFRIPRPKGHRGILPSKHFDLDYAIGISKSMAVHPDRKVITFEWGKLHKTLLMIDRSIDFKQYKGESFGTLAQMYAIDRTDAIRQYAAYKAKG